MQPGVRPGNSGAEPARRSTSLSLTGHHVLRGPRSHSWPCPRETHRLHFRIQYRAGGHVTAKGETRGIMERDRNSATRVCPSAFQRCTLRFRIVLNFQKSCKDSREHSSRPGSQHRPQGASYIHYPIRLSKGRHGGLLTMLYTLCSAQRCCSNVLFLPQDPVQVTTLTSSGHASLTSSVTTSQPSLVFDECTSGRSGS